MMSIEEIQTLIPHRYPFLFIDRVIEINLGQSLKAIKNVSINEFFFLGHFPDMPVMPGVLIVEALAQAFSVLAAKSYENEPPGLFLLTGIEETKFKRRVVPGDQLILEVSLLNNRHNILKGQGVASVNGEVACITTLKSMRRNLGEKKSHD